MKLRTEKRKRKKTFFIQKGIFVATLALFSVFNTVSAQEKKDTIRVVEVVPQYPGGDEARMKFLIDNLTYPEEARKKDLQGKVLVDFVVETDGRLTNFTIAKSVHPILDEEALRVVKLMPNWIPGNQDGKPVRIAFRLPITFAFNNDTIDPKYPGGEEARMKFLIDNLTYPKEARKKDLQGKVVVGFIVEKDGRLTNFTIEKSVHPILDAEALRVVKLMPNWIPGKIRGNAMRVEFKLPITFTLTDGRSTPPKDKKKKK